jgi:hypothetical protein
VTGFDITLLIVLPQAYVSSYRFLTGKTRVQSHSRPYVFRAGEVAVEQVFLRVLRFSPVSYYFTGAVYPSIVRAGTTGPFEAAVPEDCVSPHSHR